MHRQVRKAIKDFRMLGPEERVLVAVSGGKDSLALWDILLDLGYRASGMYLGLGIGDYSERSGEVVRRFAEGRGAELITVDLRDVAGYDIPIITSVTEPGTPASASARSEPASRFVKRVPRSTSHA